MYLKSVDIIGFKSFADKTRIELKPGVIGIVGPNGCGKSNVMESIRWCIGEMSWKALRSPSMVQVIFQGTSRRPAMSLAEVTLTFDNASSMLPVDYSEVTVTRRIYRSGESEYYLNKTQCRLRDIRELFLDTGIGGEGYAIIDQGNVDFVLSAKPEERRSLFEEAAGVSRYKAKREEALRKLEAVESDMARLGDSLSLINDQIGKLENDARKAKLYQEYKEELAAKEAAGFVREIEGLRTEIAAIEERRAPLAAESQNAQVELDQADAELSTLKLQALERENEVLLFNESLSKLKEEAGRLEERLQSAVQRKGDLSLRSEALEAELAADEKRALELQPDLARLDEELAAGALQREAKASELEGTRLALQASAARLDETLREVGRNESKAVQLAQSRQNLSRELSRVESDFQHLQVQARSSLRDHEKALHRLDEGRAELGQLLAVSQEKAAAHEQAKLAADGAENALSAAKELALLTERDQNLAATRLAECQARLEAVKAQQETNPYFHAAQAVLKAELPGVLGLMGRLVDVNADARAFAEEALGDLLASVVCEDLPAAENAIAFLRERGLGRARFLILSSVPETPAESLELPPGARALLSALRPDPRLERLARRLLADVVLQGSVLRGPHWILGGSDEAAQVRGWLQEAELAQKQAELSAQLETLRQDLAQRGAELLDAQARAEAARLDLRAKDVAAHQASHAVVERERTLYSYEQDRGHVHAEAVRHLSSIGHKLEERLALQSKAGALQADEAAALASLEELRRSREELSNEAAHRRGEFNGLETQFKHLDAQIGFLGEQKRRLELSLKAIEQAQGRRFQEKQEAASQLAQLEAQAAEAKGRLDELGRQIAELEGRSRLVFDGLEAARSAVREKEERLSSLKTRQTELQGGIHALELELSGRKTREEMACQRLSEDCSLNFAEAKERFGAQETSAERVGWLKQRLLKMGNVNMTAPEEVETLRQRFDFLTAQSEDLNKAKEDLREAIAKINATTRENFRHTYEQVREHFRRIYGVLFEGGEADLVLTMPENMLETGVEIVAMPPGKKLQSISQLSGGEKALTALALLFSFFSVKPSPFCMLDEADAALDDANVDRYITLIQQFADRCQFIVISHNKRTMEGAQTIYGVTMEESGISQLISVELEKRPDAKTSVEVMGRERPAGETAAAA